MAAHENEKDYPDNPAYNPVRENQIYINSPQKQRDDWKINTDYRARDSNSSRLVEITPNFLTIDMLTGIIPEKDKSDTYRSIDAIFRGRDSYLKTPSPAKTEGTRIDITA